MIRPALDPIQTRPLRVVIGQRYRLAGVCVVGSNIRRERAFTATALGVHNNYVPHQRSLRRIFLLISLFM